MWRLQHTGAWVRWQKKRGLIRTCKRCAGWCSITGQAGGEGEMFRHLAHFDITTSTMIVEAVLQALLARERTGKGQKIEIEMLAAALSLQTTPPGRILCDQ